MGNNIFSCCYPEGKRKGRPGKAGYRGLQENGVGSREGRAVVAREIAHGAATLRGDALGRHASREDVQPRASGTRDASRGLNGSSSAGTTVPAGSHVQHINGQANKKQEHAHVLACSIATSTTTAGAAGAPYSQHTRTAIPPPPAAAVAPDHRNGEKVLPVRGYPATRLGGSNNGAVVGGGVQDSSGTTLGVRPMGPRIVHAHPNDQRQQYTASDSRLGGRGGTQYPAAGGARGGGMFGAVGFSAAAGTGGRVVAARGMPRAVPAGAGTALAKYEMKDVLGVGSTSTCYRCVSRSSRKQFACKVVDKRAMDPKLKPLLAQFHVEIQVLQLLRHPNIIHMEDVFESEMNIHMVMEIMQGGELFDYVVAKGTLSESEASVMVRKVTSALAYMHSLDIIHRDLKPENLLLTHKRSDPEVKVIDFGLAKVLGVDDVGAQSFLGTRGYLAPEMLQREAYNKEVDVWALGVIVFVLLCGCLPFDDDSRKLNRAGAFQKFVLRFPRWAQNLSPGAKDLLSKLLTVTPQARLTAKEALEHPWVTGKAAAADNYLESPRTLRKLSRLSSPKNGRGQGGRGGGGTYGGGGNPQRLTAAEASAAAAEAHRRAEFEEQSVEYREGGLAMGGGRPRKNSI